MQPQRQLRVHTIVGTALKGAILGAISLPLIVAAYIALFVPGAMSSQPWPLMLLWPVPVGALVGLTFQVARLFRTYGYRQESGLLFAVVGALMTLLSLHDAQGPMALGGTDGALGFLISPTFGWPFLFGIVFLAWGASVLRRQRMLV